MTKPKASLRLRVFAGPNGSGKSTIIQSVRDYRIKSIPVDFGIYVNADDIAVLLRNNKFDFSAYKVAVTNTEFQKIVTASGLINKDFTQDNFASSYRLKQNKITLLKENNDEHLAQIIADFLRKKLLDERKKFSFETVFSHPSKLEIMRQAAAQGYKVYLYFVSTESPEINKYRVTLRTLKSGHDVPPDKIESRYYRSLDLLFEAAQLAYQVYFFDNTGEQPELFAHFKNVKGKKKWDKIDTKSVPNWFLKYYSEKVKK